ncbi:hypothetical protein ACFL6S_26945 [Candidatus Poribacteria bacterium]
MYKPQAVIHSIISAGDGIIFLSEFLIIPILCLGLLLEFLPTSPTVIPANSDDAAIPVPELKSRKNFSASYGDTVLFADSEDAWEAHPLAAKPEDAMAFVQGLAYGLTAVPETSLNRHPEKPFLFGGDEYLDKLIRGCATVDKAIGLTQRFDFEKIKR